MFSLSVKEKLKTLEIEFFFFFDIIYKMFGGGKYGFIKKYD